MTSKYPPAPGRVRVVVGDQMVPYTPPPPPPVLGQGAGRVFVAFDYGANPVFRQAPGRPAKSRKGVLG